MSPTFAQLGVPESICRALESRGITEPFEIQAATIADGLAGRDVCGRAPTGSGKTLAFGIPLVAAVDRAEPRRPRGLILAPTRELAEQIAGELRSFAGKVRIGVVYGGVGSGKPISKLRSGTDILVACPGRLEDLIQMGEVDLGAVDRVVLDEADRMADMGFMPAVRRLLDQTATERQTVLFSATLDGDVATLTRDHQRDPVRHEVGETTPDITSAHHRFWEVERSDRAKVTAEAVDAVWPAIIFTRTRHGADRLKKQLSKAGVEAAAIHGGRSQGQRNRALADFSANRVHALVATDVAARGIHVDDVAAVVHYDPPEDHKAYVHRSGRTARAGRGGVVVSLLSSDQCKDAGKLQRKLGLEQRITDADPAELRGLSDTEAPTLAPPRPERSDRPAGDRRRSSGSGSRKRRPGNGSRNGSGGGSGSEQRRPKKKGSTSSNTNKSKGRRRTANGSQTAGGAKGSGRPNRKERRAHLQRDVGTRS